MGMILEKGRYHQPLAGRWCAAERVRLGPLCAGLTASASGDATLTMYLSAPTGRTGVLATVCPPWLQGLIAFCQRGLILASPRTILCLLFFAATERVSLLNGTVKGAVRRPTRRTPQRLTSLCTSHVAAVYGQGFCSCSSLRQPSAGG